MEWQTLILIDCLFDDALARPRAPHYVVCEADRARGAQLVADRFY